MIKVNKLFIVPKTMDELDRILDNQYGKKGPERFNAEVVRGFTLNLVAHILATGCRCCESKEPILCEDCGNGTFT